MNKVLIALTMFALLTGCQQSNNWHDFTGKNRDVAELRMDIADCKLDSQSAPQTDASNCPNNGCSLGVALGNAISQQGTFTTCLESRGWEQVKASPTPRYPTDSGEVHILARKNITTFADLKGKILVVTGGSLNTTVNIFVKLGITPSKIYPIKPERGIVAVLNNEADAMVFVGDKPVTLLKNLEKIANVKTGPNAGKLKQVHFLPLSDERLLKEYKPATITHDDYSFVKQDVPTVVVADKQAK